MEFYVLDNNFNRQDLLEGYTSAIWTERYSVTGDFQMVFSDDEYAKLSSLNEGAFVGEKDSLHVGIVEKTIFKEGKVTLSGSFLEHFLRFRYVTWVGAEGDESSFKDSLYRVGTPEAVMAMCIFTYAGPYLALGDTLGVRDYEDEMFSRLDVGIPLSDYYPVTPQLEFSYPNPINMYEFMKTTAEPNAVGWRLYPVPNGVNYDLYFRPYRGLDQSRDQSTNTPVIFGESFGSLKSVEEIHTIEGYLTNVHVFAPKIDPAAFGYDPKDIVGHAQVPGTQDFTDFQRRTAVFKADDITPEDYHWANAGANDNGIYKAWEVLMQRAKDILANNNLKRMLDGEVVAQNQYKYGVDYNMGDVITLKGVHGAYQNARVIEYVRSEDGSGQKAYPTITVI
jgi:hypothetical protein